VLRLYRHIYCAFGRVVLSKHTALRDQNAQRVRRRSGTTQEPKRDYRKSIDELESSALFCFVPKNAHQMGAGSESMYQNSAGCSAMASPKFVVLDRGHMSIAFLKHSFGLPTDQLGREMRSRKLTVTRILLRATRVVLSAAAFALVIPIAYAQSGNSPALHTRMRWQDFISGPEGNKRLASLQKAIAKMRSLDNSPPDSVNFRLSWKYWANIHGYLGQGSKFGTVAYQTDRLNRLQMAQFLPYLVGATGKPGIQDQTPPDDGTKDVWATCVHSPQGKQLNFFGWHRMYLYYFERVLRWAANDPTLTLPYWDYTNPAETALPDAFQDTGSPLYDWRRSEALNEGLAILNPQITDIDSPLSTDTNFLQYEGDIESGVHGNVHCSVGQTCPIAIMGLVGVAANDPIFYEHHANIDRIWSCWQNAHPHETPGDWQNEQFTFVDETGTKITRPVRDFLDTKTLGYVYDNESNCMRVATLQATANETPGLLPAEQAFPNILGSVKSIGLKPTTTSVDISFPKGTLHGLTGSTPTPTKLLLRDVSSKSDPAALLGVFVERKDLPQNRQYVGTINWFGVFDAMQGMEGEKHDGQISRTFQYDITRQLRRLELKNAQELTVVFEATSGLAPSKKKPSRERALAAPSAATFRADAALTIGAVELRQ
jgi:hypothetical protein